MLIKELQIDGIRNLAPLKLQLDPNMYVFVGLNGSGKTSLLESICFLVLGRSFRTSNVDRLINFDKQFVAVSAVYSNKEAQQIKISALKHKNKEKISKIGGVRGAVAQIANIAPTQIIHEASSGIIFKEPEWRRKFLDWIVFYANQDYQQLWRDFNRALHQRNSILKKNHPRREGFLKELDKVFVGLSEKIQKIRKETWVQFKEIWSKCFEELKINCEIKPEITLFDGWTGNLLEKLEQCYETDLKQGFTCYGPHRADLFFVINGNPAKEVLSRGQGKTISASLILARAEFFQNLQRDNNAISVLLIDDLCAELDDINGRKIIEFLLAKHRKTQVFITGVEKNILLKVLPQEGCQWFSVKNGVVVGD